MLDFYFGHIFSYWTTCGGEIFKDSCYRAADVLPDEQVVVEVKIGANHFTNPDHHKNGEFSFFCKVDIQIYEWTFDEKISTDFMELLFFFLLS